LKWGHALLGGEHQQWNAGRHIDLVLGADLTYDASLFPALMATFGELFDLYPGVKVVLAATVSHWSQKPTAFARIILTICQVRNPKTLEHFLELCNIRKMAAEFVEFKEAKQEGPFYSTEAPFRLFIITRP